MIRELLNENDYKNSVQIFADVKLNHHSCLV